MKTLAGSGAAAGSAWALPGPRPQRRPNILFIITDQQSSTMLSIAGNRWLKTPALDGLAQTGVRFTRAYAADPVCLPSRFAFQTGRYPSLVGVRHNGSQPTELVNAMPARAMGHLLRKAGYRL